MYTLKFIEYDKPCAVYSLFITGATNEQLEELSEKMSHDGKYKNGRMVFKLENDVEFTVDTKKKEANLRAIIVGVLGENEKVEENEQSQSRRVVTLSYAVDKNMAHSKPWMATLNQIDTGVVPAGYEGELVCYVQE